MKRGFYTIMAAQFFSSLADNALFVAAVELIRTSGGAEWQRAALVPMFALFYVVLAPFVGAFADSRPKGEVMFISNAIKVLGCLMMLFGTHPLLSYAIVGLGAAAYSPAKYGILTELLPASQLVKANGWIEISTVCAALFGVMLGGYLVSAHWLSLTSFFEIRHWLNFQTQYATSLVLLLMLYGLAAGLNAFIPDSGIAYTQHGWHWRAVWQTFKRDQLTLWRDPLGSISLSVTTLFWGVSGNLRYIVLAWSAAALGYSTTQASSLVGVVAIGTAVGAVVASVRMKLHQATRVMPLGIAMGVLVMGMNFIDNVWVAAPFLILLGALGGFLVVPMNALLQHRGHNLMGAGRSIAVQNFNEQACILLLGGFYSFSTGMGLSAFGAITAFDFVVASIMWLIKRWHEHNLREHSAVLNHLIDVAKNDNLHG